MLSTSFIFVQSGCRSRQRLNFIFVVDPRFFFEIKIGRISACRQAGNPVYSPRRYVGASTPSPRRVRYFSRAAGNRTQSTRTRSVRTTGILQPDNPIISTGRAYYQHASPQQNNITPNRTRLYSIKCTVIFIPLKTKLSIGTPPRKYL